MDKERTGVHVHLDDPVLNGSLDLFLGGTGTAVENEEPIAAGLEARLMRGSYTHKGLGDVPPNFSLTCFWCLPKSSG